MFKSELSVCSLFLLLFAFPVPGTSKSTNPAIHSVNLPLAFEPNRGQAEHGVDYVARGNGYSVLLKPSGAVIALHQRTGQGVNVLHVGFLGTRANSTAFGAAQLPGHSHYIRGRNPQAWIQDVPQFARVQYSNIYPGIDLVYYGNQGKLEYDFLVKPNAAPKRITMRFDGAKKLSIDENENLVVQVGASSLIQKQPLAYQTVHGKPVKVKVRYRIVNNHDVAFEVGKYEKTSPLVIDPALVYSTYLGGTDFDVASSVVLDSQGNIYVAGSTSSSDFPVANAAQSHLAGGHQDVFITKIKSDGSAILFSTYWGGTKDEAAFGTAVDAANNLYVTGSTNSPDFPVANAYQDHLAGTSAAFLTKFSPTGSVVYSTYLGGSDGDFGYGVAVDILDNVYVTGAAGSTDFPATKRIGGNAGGSPSAFIAKLDNTGSGLVYSLLLSNDAGSLGRPDDFGGSVGNSVKIDLLGYAYVTGVTQAPGFPTTPGESTGSTNVSGQFPDAFVTKVAIDGGSLVWSTYLGGAGRDIGSQLAIDPAGSVFVTGETNSTNFPIQGAVFQETCACSEAVFLSIFTTEGNLIYSSYIGASGFTFPGGVALDGFGDIYIAGTTMSLADTTSPPPDFPVVNAIQPPHTGTGFVLKFDHTATNLLYSDPYFSGLIGGLGAAQK